MKKIHLVAGIIFMCVALCFYFLVGLNLRGEWWPHIVGTIFLLIGLTLVVIYDRMNNGKEERAKAKEELNRNIEKQKTELHEHLEKEKAVRDEMLKNIHKTNRK